MARQKKESPRKRSGHAIEESKDRIQLILSGLRIAAKKFEEQGEARAAIARHAKREAILRACARIDRERTDLLDDLLRLEQKYAQLENVAKTELRGHADPAGAGDRGNPSEGSHQVRAIAGSR